MEVDGTPTSELLFHSVTDSQTGAAFYVAAKLHRCPQDPAALDEARLAVTITDGIRAWSGQELTEHSLGSTIPNRIRHTLEALTGMQPVTEAYTVKFTCPPEGPGQRLAVEVEWDNKRHGKDATYRTHFSLDAVPDAAGAVRGVMGAMLGEFGALAAEAAALGADCEQLQGRIATDHGAVEEHATRKERKDEDTAVKVAALLVSKHDKLRELQAEVKNQGAGGGEGG